jgi:serine/threonine protein phosphatase PrpC
VSDNKLVEGLQPIGTVADESVRGSDIDHVVRTYAGVSKKGYAPYNPRKRNQDAIMMVEDAKTMTLLFGVLDGHGEAGDLVSHYITARLPDRVFANPKWETDPVAAMTAETARLEKAVLSGKQPQRNRPPLSTGNALIPCSSASSRFSASIRPPSPTTHTFVL